MQLSVVLIVLLSVSCGGQNKHFKRQNENSYKFMDDADLLTPQMIEKYGYTAENHTITTADGYILELDRIPYGKAGPLKRRSAILLSHGIIANSAEWIISGPGKGLAYVLADKGFDVWMLNSRGNSYSRKHIRFDPDNSPKQFWNFSWHEMGIYDLPATIDYILNLTKQKKIFFLGHSQGTTSFYVMCSEKPEYNEKIKSVFSLAPTAFQLHMERPYAQILAPFERELLELFESLEIYEMPGTNNFIRRLAKTMCNDHSRFQYLCTFAYFQLLGSGADQYNSTLLPTIISHMPAGASIKQLFHYLQEVNSGKFRQFDYGPKGNLAHYGKQSPPDYKLKNCRVPHYLFYSNTDGLISAIDVNNLYQQLPNATRYVISKEIFSHMDFIFGIQTPQMLYTKIIDLMLKYET